ncbi:hypothetical protein GCM10011487_62530 [Steroidobacter agaridevorans]|uniref:DUF4114 domain-containing protein n=1 Tax=Steroidobacter agaridevorans TaxID=2695856 RepID=A0A829YN63_9GAMM|nr:hypothetical protein GCM10011487_62530 [Steroidobacter agaridevorans]GFE87078.1 hypothetical protein GCM10011488_20320 [Steroidobacter agaridevorans]
MAGADVTNRVSILQLSALAALGLAAAQANALCSFGGSGEPSLQGSFDSMLGANTLSATTSCLDDGDDAAWTTVGSIGQIDIVLELAGNASTNVFGVYDLNNPNARLSIFDGADAAGDQAVLRLRQTVNGWRVSVQEVGSGGWTHQLISTSAFGFYLSVQDQGTFYSQSARNADGVDHLYAYQGTGTPFLSGTLEGEFFSREDYILAWEDLLSGGDRDYQDFVAVVQDITPVPLPTPVLLLISGLVGLAGVSRRTA